MKREQLGCRGLLVAVLVAGCGGGGAGRDAGGDRVDQAGATGGTTGTGGTGTGGGGATGSGGAAATGGTPGTGGALGNGGAAGNNAGGAVAQGGAGGRGGGAGQNAGGAGGRGAGGGAGQNAGGAGGRGGAGGGAGQNVGGAGGVGGSAGAGGRGGAGGGAGQGGGGVGGIGGAGGGAGQGGTAGTPPLHVTRAEPHPANQAAILGMLVAVDSQDQAVVIGPATSTGLPPAVSWYPRQGATRRLVFANAATPRAMAIGPADVVWMAGYLFGPVSFGGPTLPAVENGYYLCRLGADGSHQQSVSVTTSASPELRAVTTDAAGNVYVVGSLYTFGPSTTTAKAFVTKLSPTGQVLWNREFAGTGSSAYVGAVAITPGNEVAIAGGFNDQLALGTPPLTSQSTMSGGYNGFWATLDSSNGNLVAVFRFGGTIFDLANTLDVTSDGALRIGGQLSGSSSVGGMAATAEANGSAFVAEVSTGGVARWVRVISGRGIVFGSDTNTAGRTFAAGRIDGATSDSFVASVGTDGVVTFPLRTATGDSNGAMAAAADRHGGVWVVGELLGSANFGTGPITGPDATQPTNYLVHLEP